MTVDGEREEAVMRELLRAATEPPAPGLTDRVLAAVRERQDEAPETRTHWGLGLVASLLAGALVLTLALGVRLIRPAARPGEPTSNAVQSQSLLSIGDTGTRLFFTSASTGWLARESVTGSFSGHTTLYRTSDGGRTWSARFSYEGGLPSQVIVDGSGSGMLVGGQRAQAGADLVLFRSRDGGDTWQPAPVPPGVTAWGVPDFVDALRGWVLGSLGPGQAEILLTTDGGLTWSPSSPFNDRANFPGLSSLQLRILWTGDGRAIVVPPPGSGGGDTGAHVIISEDGGATWRSSFLAAPRGQSANAANAMLDARLLPDGSGVLFLQPIDSNGRSAGLFAYRTADAGRDWSQPVRLDGPTAGTARVLFALDGTHWWASAGSGGDLVTTSDGGRTISRLRHLLPANYAVESLGFSSPSDGWLVAVDGGRRAAFATHDAGAHWTPLTPP